MDLVLQVLLYGLGAIAGLGWLWIVTGGPEYYDENRRKRLREHRKNEGVGND